MGSIIPSEKPEPVMETTLEPGIGFANGSAPYDELEDQVPYLAGSMNGWRYQKMKTVFDYCNKLDGYSFREPFEYFSSVNAVSGESLADLSNKEKKKYEELRVNQVLNLTFKGWE